MLRTCAEKSWHVTRALRVLPSRCLATASDSKTSQSPTKDAYDLAIVGGGIVGLATARQLLLTNSNLKVILLEKEPELSMHQSGHNSGVIHAGIYYTPGSLRARLCVEGLKSTYKYCDEKKIPYKKCGKLIVAVEPHEVAKLEDLRVRGEKNDVPDLKVLHSEKEIREIEPNCRGLKALHSPHTGIVDWRRVALSYGDDFQAMGGKIVKNYEVDRFSMAAQNLDFPIVLHPSSTSTQQMTVQCRHVITCGGLYSDRLAEKSGCSPTPRIVPFRGDYLLLRPEKRSLVRGNIYPVPDPRFPFLGVHFTPRMDGNVWLGPNAVLAFKREGYGRFDFSMKDTIDALSYPGLRKIAMRFLSVGMSEMAGAFLIGRAVKQLQRFVPDLKVADVTRGPAGVRAQALDPQGNLVDDFVFDSGASEFSSRVLHVRNAPSPAATSSLAIARMVVEAAKEKFKF